MKKKNTVTSKTQTESQSTAHDRRILAIYVRVHFGERPAMSRLWADVRAGAVSCVVVRDLTRLTRNVAEGFSDALWQKISAVRALAANTHRNRGPRC